jgi:outer membrane protein assembly factor BamB/tetratricopeptide (TPR) repeat protein
MTRRRLLSSLLGVLVLLPVKAFAADLPPVVLPGESRSAASRLAEADKRIVEKKWPEAIAELQAVLDAAGNDLVPLTPQHCVQARRLCHVRLAALPPAALRLYRDRVEPQARKWLEQGTATRDVRLLRRVVDEAFCSRAAEKALDLLGDLAFERGRFEEAEAWWRLLAPLPRAKKAEGDPATGLAYPDPQGDPARAQAKQLLARLFIEVRRPAAPGGSAGWAGDLKAFRGRYPEAEGALAGRTGLYADLLEGVGQKGLTPADPGWTTFGGSATRGLVVPAPPRLLERLGQMCRRGPTWCFDLERRTRVDGPPRPEPSVGPTALARSLAFHPVLTGDHVLVADARYVSAYDLRTGKVSDWYDAEHFNGGIKPKRELPAFPDLRYTLTVAEGAVFARLGLQGIQDVRPPPPPRPRELGRKDAKNNESLLVCLNLEPGLGGDRFRWMVRAGAVENGHAAFEGAPVVHAGLVYIAATRWEAGDRLITAVDCYPANPEDSRPPLLWRTDVCETRELRPGEARYRHHLLTLAGSRVVYCSHSGAVVALDALTGRRCWGVRYRRGDPNEQEDLPALHDLAPVLFAGGRLYVAPADSDQLLCLDPATGQTLWERKSLQVVHLLGVGQGRLIFSTPGGLQAVDPEDGSSTDGWILPDSGGTLTPMGRGLLVGDLVLWPTAPVPGKPWGAVYAVRQSDGRQPEDPSLLHRIPAGNLAFANGCLAVTDRQTLSVYVPAGLQLPEREQDARREPTSAPALLELARAEANAGLTGRALESFTRAERLATPTEKQGARLREEARAGRQALLLERASRAAQGKRWDEAEAALKQAAGDFSLGARLQALARTAQVWQEAGEPARAVAAWQAVLDADDLRGLQAYGRDSVPAPAGALAAEAIAQLRREHGDKVYQAVQKRAGDLWAAAPDEGRPAVGERLAREFPGAAVTREALLHLARSHEQANRPGAAAHAYRRLLAGGATGPEQAAALAGLARAYERQRCWEAARAAWQRLEGAHGADTLPELGAGRCIRDFVTEHLRGPAFAAPAPGAPALGLPVLRTWAATLDRGEEVLPAAGPLAGAASELLWSARAVGGTGQMVCRERATGKVRWRCPLPFVPEWVACPLDLVLAAGEWGVAGIRREDGERLWDFPAPVTNLYPGGGDGLRVLQEPRPPDPLGGFQLAAGRLLLLQGGRRLFALEPETGRVLWQRQAPGAAFREPAPWGRFFPGCDAGAGTVLVQTSSGRRRLLDSGTGRLVHEAGAGHEPWPRDPLVLDERTVCLVPDDRRVLLLDRRTGQERWTWTQKGFSTRTGEAPLALGDARTVLVLAATNLGYELYRLDRETGKPCWPRPCLLNLRRADAVGWALDNGTVYYARDNILCARSLEDGRLLWEQALGGEAKAWHVRRLRDAVVAYPAQTRAVRLQFRWLFGSVQWKMGYPGEAGEERDFSVVCCDPGTGKVVERLNFQSEAPRVRTQVRPESGNTVLPRCWASRGLAPDPQPGVQFLERGLVIVRGGKIWALGAKEQK